MLAPETNHEDAKSVAAFLRTLSDAELSQGIASPRAFIDRLPGFTIHHLKTDAEPVVVQLALDEQQRRRDDDTGRRAQWVNWIAIGSVVIAVLALTLSLAAYLK